MLGPPLEPVGGASGRLIEGWWARTVTGGGRVIPDGGVDLMWSPGFVPWIAGPDTRPRAVELAAGRSVVAVRLRTGFAAGVLGVGVDRAVDDRVPLDAIWSPSLLERLLAELARASDERAAVDALAAGVVERVRGGDGVDPIASAAVAAIRHGTRPSRAGLSERQFRRRFSHAVGYGPATLQRIVRLEAAAAQFLADPQRRLAEVAAAAGYFDESHFARDCGQLTGWTPGEWRAHWT